MVVMGSFPGCVEAILAVMPNSALVTRRVFRRKSPSALHIRIYYRRSPVLRSLALNY